eukprot:sb/3476728/
MWQEPTDTRKQPIRARYLGHVTVYQPIIDPYFLIRSVPAALRGSDFIVCVSKLPKEERVAMESKPKRLRDTDNDEISVIPSKLLCKLRMVLFCVLHCVWVFKYSFLTLTSLSRP